MTDLREKMIAGIWGLLVGDALGVPYEFHAPQSIPPQDLIDFHPPATFNRAHSGVPPGTWSDDGAQALCLLASLLESGGFDPHDFADRLTQWYENGYMAVDGVVFDCGITTSRAISSLRSGTHPLDAGPSGDYDNGNGSLMRVLPLALWHQGPDEVLVRDAELQSRVTHGHLRSQVCCALYCLWARNVLHSHSDAWNAAVNRLRLIYSTRTEAARELEENVRPDDLSQGQGSGYVVDCLRCARWCVDQGTYEQVVKAAVALGNDTDTTACAAGGIAGIRDGLEAIPTRWRDALRGRELLDPLLERLKG